jgi:6-phosphogluconolactonase
MSVHRYTEPGGAELAEACSRHILSCLEQTLAGHDIATFAVSGGNSPRPMFEALARADFDWSRVHLFWTDERCVPPFDPLSNFRMVDQSFVIPARFPRRNVHRVYAELPPDRAAARYSEDILEILGHGHAEIPHFDLIHLGMGQDGHTASLFPGDPLIQDRERVAGATYVEKLAQWRITLLPAVLLNARHIVVYSPGADKAEMIKTVFDGEFDAMKYPAQIPAHLGRNVAWFLDRDAARLLDA